MSVLNADRPFGAIPVGTLSGSPWQGSLRRCNADGSTAIYRGDKVAHGGTGTRAGFTVAVSNAANGLTDGTIVGLMVSPVVDRSLAVTEHPGYCPASGAPDCLVVVAPDLIMLTQEDNDTDPIMFSELGQASCDVTTTTGSTTTGVAAWELDSSTATSSSTGPVRIYAFYDAPDNLQADDSGAPGGGGATASNRPKWLCTWLVADQYLRTGADL